MNPYRSKLVLVILSVAILSIGCHITDANPPEITGSYPSQNAVGIPNDARVWVEFSEGMDQPWTETAFSLFADSDRPQGQFVWEGNKLIFIPRGPLTTGRVYTMLVSKTAEDSSGNNLRDDFQINFTVNPDSVKPYIVSTTPTYGQTGVAINSVLTIVFSKPVDPTSLIPGITISPSVIGAFTVNGTGETVTFTPQSNLLNGTVYTMNINTNVKDLAGNVLLQGQTVSFVVGNDFLRPTINSTISNLITLQDGVTTSLVSRNDPIVITFSELMNTTTVANALTISPTAGFSKVFTTVGVSTVATLTFSPPLDSETLYTLTVNNSATDIANNILNQNYNYQFITNAADSIRPTVLGVRQALTNNGLCTTPPVPPENCKFTCIAGHGICDGQTLSGTESPAGPAYMLQNDVLLAAEQVDTDTSASTATYRIVLKVYFSRPMNLSSLVQATTYTPIISGAGIINVTDVQLDVTQQIMSVYVSGWTGLAGYYKLKIAGGVAKDTTNNLLKNDFIIFINS